MRTLCTIVFALASACVTRADELAPLTQAEKDALRATILRLGAEDADVRGKASDELTAAGPRAAEFLRGELQSEAARDPEIQARLQEVVLTLVAEARIAEVLKDAPIRPLADHLKRRSCRACGSQDWALRELTSTALARALPRFRFFTLDWTCCKDEDAPSEMLAFCRKPDAVFPIVNVTSFKIMRAWVDPVKTREQAAETAGVLLGVSPPLAGGPPPAKPRVVSVEVTGDAKSGWKCEARESGRTVSIQFDERGALFGIVVYGR